MFWIAPEYRERLSAAAVASYDDAARLEPTDDYVEKQGRSTGRYRLDVGDRTLSLYVKKHLRLPWWQRLLGATRLFPGPAEHANLRRAAELGIRVPEAVFAGADARHLPRARSPSAVAEARAAIPHHHPEEEIDHVG